MLGVAYLGKDFSLFNEPTFGDAVTRLSTEVFMTYKQGLAALLLSTAIATTGCAENPADKVPSATVAAPATPAAAQTPVAQATTQPTMEGVVFEFGDGTEVGFEGSKVTGSHKGGFKTVSGTITVPGEDVSKAMVDIKMDMSSTWADDPKLEGHLKSEDFFDVAKYPTSTFVSSKIEKSETGHNVTGNLTFHGVTKEISFPATITMEGDNVKTQAEFAINRKDFGVVYPGKPDDLIRDEVVIRFDIAANKKA